MDIASFLAKNGLPTNYQHIAQKWFTPLAKEIASHQSGANQPFFVGVNGCQGSGKSTLCDYLTTYFNEVLGLSSVTISLDDFYYSQSHRQSLAIKVHQLLSTRGVPGTHDVKLATSVLSALKAQQKTAIPRFDKSTDNPFPQSQWDNVTQPVDIIIVEGWCWGTPAQTKTALSNPINSLESEEDNLGIWRNFVNTQLAGDYQTLFAMMDYWVMLKAPSFDSVYQWRCEQEHKLAANNPTAPGLMSDQQIGRFIQFYQRLTEHSLDYLPPLCDTVFELDNQRQIVNVTRQGLSEAIV